MEVFIEISKGSHLKYEYDHEKHCLVLDRVLHNTQVFPYNYGFIPNTLSPDGDPVDVILICDHTIIPGCIVKCKIIGGINTEDEKGQDDKIFAVLDDKLESASLEINDITDIKNSELKKIKYFLTHYKDNELGKYITIKEIYNRETAINIINKYSINK